MSFRFKGLQDVYVERLQHVSREGFNSEHDNQYCNHELVWAACAYALNDPTRWPFDVRWWKPSTLRRNLVKAAALLVAEIDRIDRQPKPSTLEAIIAGVMRSRGLSPGKMGQLSILTSAIGKLSKALLDRDVGIKTDEEVYTEALQVAVTAIRVFEEGPRERVSWEHAETSQEETNQEGEK